MIRNIVAVSLWVGVWAIFFVLCDMAFTLRGIVEALRDMTP